MFLVFVPLKYPQTCANHCILNIHFRSRIASDLIKHVLSPCSALKFLYVICWLRSYGQSLKGYPCDLYDADGVNRGNIDVSNIAASPVHLCGIICTLHAILDVVQPLIHDFLRRLLPV